MTLHVFSAAPTSLQLLEDCCTSLQDGDALLLLGEGVHAAWPGGASQSRIAALPDTITVHALAEDCAARGLQQLPARCVRTDYVGFVALACKHTRSVSWF